MDALISDFKVVYLIGPSLVLMLIVETALIFRILKLHGSSSAPAAIQEPGPESSSSSHQSFYIAGIVLGVFTFFGTQGFIFFGIVIAAALGGTPRPGQSGILLTILLVGTTLAAFMIAGGWTALNSSDPVIIRRGTRAQAIPAALVAALFWISVLFF